MRKNRCWEVVEQRKIPNLVEFSCVGKSLQNWKYLYSQIPIQEVIKMVWKKANCTKILSKETLGWKLEIKVSEI